MLHLGKNTTSRIISKGIAAGHSQNTYRGLVSAHRKATGARNFTNCDSLLIGDKCGAHTVPYIEAKNSSAVFEHEATTSKISEDMLFYCRQRGMTAEEATALVVNGFVRDVLQQLPMEFTVEAQKLISISLEGSVGLMSWRASDVSRCDWKARLRSLTPSVCRNALDRFASPGSARKSAFLWSSRLADFAPSTHSGRKCACMARVRWQAICIAATGARRLRAKSMMHQSRAGRYRHQANASLGRRTAELGIDAVANIELSDRRSARICRSLPTIRGYNVIA